MGKNDLWIKGCTGFVLENIALLRKTSGMSNRFIRLKRNAVFALLLQLTTVVSGFVLPKLILHYYGSETNGLVSSINQFISLIAFLDMGVGAVVQSAMYKPLANGDDEKLSQIIASAEKFMRIIAITLASYICILMMVYPRIVKPSLGMMSTAFLILAMGINGFSQYYFGVTDSILLSADQRGYIVNLIKICTLVINVVLSYILIVVGMNISEVKFATAAVFMLRPIVLRCYVTRKYRINRHATYEEEPITQKWNGIAQHVSSVVLGQTDVVVLTLFSSLSNVSIYSVYFLVVGGLEQLVVAIMNGFTPLLGEYIAKGDKENAKKVYDWTEWLGHNISTVIFGTCAYTLTSFVMLYTKGINDADYYQPLFAILITVAWGMYCFRIPYITLILASGHYKQTQGIFVLGAIINVALSILFVASFGICGVALGTFVSLFVQMIMMIYYNERQLLKRGAFHYAKIFLVQIAIGFLASMLMQLVYVDTATVLGWVCYLAVCILIFALISVIVNLILYRERMVELRGRFTNAK